MTKEIWYWLILFLLAIGGVWGIWPAAGASFDKPKACVSFLVVLLFLILGMAEFGSPVK